MDLIPAETVEDQEFLLRAFDECYDVVYLKAKRKGFEHPAIFVMDLRDKFARELMSSIPGQPQKVDEALQRAADGTIPIVTSYLSIPEAAKFFEGRLDDISQALYGWPNSPLANDVPVIVVANGLGSLAARPKPEW